MFLSNLSLWEWHLIVCFNLLNWTPRYNICFSINSSFLTCSGCIFSFICWRSIWGFCKYCQNSGMCRLTTFLFFAHLWPHKTSWRPTRHESHLTPISHWQNYIDINSFFFFDQLTFILGLWQERLITDHIWYLRPTAELCWTSVLTQNVFLESFFEAKNVQRSDSRHFTEEMTFPQRHSRVKSTHRNLTGPDS